MSLCFRSLEDLGRGAWRIASVTPLSPAKEKLALRDASAVAPASADSRRQPARPPSSRSGPTPHDLLWDTVVARWPTAVREFEGVVLGASEPAGHQRLARAEVRSRGRSQGFGFLPGHHPGTTGDDSL